MISFNQQSDNTMLNDQYQSIVGASYNRVSELIAPELESDIIWTEITEDSAKFEMEFGIHVYSGKCMWVENHARIISCSRGMVEEARDLALEAFRELEFLEAKEV